MNHALTGAGEQDSICVFSVYLFVRVCERVPTWSAVRDECRGQSTRIRPDKVATPAEANPVEFKALDFEFGGENLTCIAGSDIRFRCQIPMVPWIRSMEI